MKRTISVSENGRMFVKKVHTAGKVQMAFKAQIVPKVSACVATGVKKGMSQAEIRKVVSKCGKAVKGTKLSL